MKIETGQLRVWDDAITRDKTPFLVLEQVDTGWADLDWRIIWSGITQCWSDGRIKRFSKVVNGAR